MPPPRKLRAGHRDRRADPSERFAISGSRGLQCPRETLVAVAAEAADAANFAVRPARVEGDGSQVSDSATPARGKPSAV